MTGKSVSREAEEILLATDMIRLGARLQVLQAETSLSYDRLARLYREVEPQVLITELYPFGRRPFRFELEPLLAGAAEGRARPLVIASVRDILVPSTKAGRDHEMVPSTLISTPLAIST